MDIRVKKLHYDFTGLHLARVIPCTFTLFFFRTNIPIEFSIVESRFCKQNHVFYQVGIIVAEILPEKNEFANCLHAIRGRGDLLSELYPFGYVSQVLLIVPLRSTIAIFASRQSNGGYENRKEKRNKKVERENGKQILE